MPFSNPLCAYLLESGIRPHAFAYFLSRYIQTRPTKKRDALAYLLNEQLKSQAELINYHLRH